MKMLNDFVAENPELFRQEELILETTELIAKTMEQNKISKADLARKLKKSKPFISQCLSGEQNLTLRTVADLFGALGYKIQIGATALDQGSKTIHRLYPIGGWAFEKNCGSPELLIDCAASAETEEEESFRVLRGSMIENTVVLDKTSLEEARALMRCADLESIRFVKFGLTLSPSGGDSRQEIDVSTHSKITGESSEGELHLYFDLRVKGKREDAVVLEIAGRLQAIYKIPLEENPTSTQIKAFARSNGMLNVWAYWREFVQSATARAGLAPLTLPLFRVIPGPPKSLDKVNK